MDAPSRRVMVLVPLALIVASLLAGCVDGPATYRFQGRLDRGLTSDEHAELVRVTGAEPEIVATAIGCPGDVDPYECNHHSLSVSGMTKAECEEAVAALRARTYWRGEPSCHDMADHDAGHDVATHSP